MGDGYMGSPNVAYAAAAQLRNPMSTMTAGRKTLQTIRPSEAVVSNGTSLCHPSYWMTFPTAYQRPNVHVLHDAEFQFEMLSPSEGSEGDMITAVLRLSPGYVGRLVLRRRVSIFRANLNYC
jgi:hypothetical protein